MIIEMAMVLSLARGLEIKPACDIRSQTPAEYCEAYCTDQCSFYNTSLGWCMLGVHEHE